MSMTKNCAAFDRLMEEQRMADERSFEEYQEEQYFRTFRKDRFPPDHEQVTPPKGTTPKNNANDN